MFMRFLSLFIYHLYMSDALGVQKTALDPLKLELWIAVSYHVGAPTAPSPFV